jgi:polyhydroxybutyrate depolymerase
MAMTLGCVGKVRAVAAEGASIVPRGSCNQPLPPVLELHGTADPFVPYTGGGGSRSGAFAGTTAQAAEGRLAIWATQSGCASSPTSTQVAADVTRLDWGRCATLYRMDGAGHGWPGHTGPDPVGGLGPTSSSVNASQLMTDFFLARLR